MSGPSVFCWPVISLLLLAGGASCAKVVAPPAPSGEPGEIAESGASANSDASANSAASANAAEDPEAHVSGAAAASEPLAPAMPGGPTTQAATSASVAPTSSAAPGAAPPRLASLEIGEPSFQNGEAPKAKAALDKLSARLLACVNDNGGLTAAAGSVELQFLVRLAGVAEGASVLKSSGISVAAKRCLVDAVQRKSVGIPTSDPVGVTVVLTLKSAS